MKDKFSIILSTMGVIAILCALFIWFWLGTVGLYITLYSWGMNKDIGSFFMLGIGIIIGGIVFKIGIGILRREQWSRKALILFWSVFSICIIGCILLNIGDAFTDIRGHFETWLQEVAIWSTIAVVGILHIIFLKHSRVKELFKFEVKKVCG